MVSAIDHLLCHISDVDAPEHRMEVASTFSTSIGRVIAAIAVAAAVCTLATISKHASAQVLRNAPAYGPRFNSKAQGALYVPRRILDDCVLDPGRRVLYRCSG